MTNAKAIVGLLIAALGAGGTAALAFADPGSPVFAALTIGLAALTPIATYLGVYAVSNKPAPVTSPWFTGLDPNKTIGEFAAEQEDTNE